jgi:hypothetical protein
MGKVVSVMPRPCFTPGKKNPRTPLDRRLGNKRVDRYLFYNYKVNHEQNSSFKILQALSMCNIVRMAQAHFWYTKDIESQEHDSTE